MAISSTTPRPLPVTPSALKAHFQNDQELVTVTRMSDKAARRAKFEEAWAKIRDELVEHIEGEGFPPEAVKWYKDVCLSVCSIFLYRLVTAHIAVSIPAVIPPYSPDFSLDLAISIYIYPHDFVSPFIHPSVRSC